MSLNLDSPGRHDESVINRRDERQLIIALAAILTMWLLTFGLVSVSTQLSSPSPLLNGSASALDDG
jgi:hypothetical protein